MDTAIGLLVIAALVAGGWFYVTKIQMPQKRAAQELEQARLRAENKVKMYDPILRSDIEALEKSGSLRAQEAIEIRRIQIQQGRHPEA